MPDNMSQTDNMRTARIKRLIYRASYTGMKETDLLLGQFAEHHLPDLDNEHLSQFEALLEAGDPALLGWLKGDEAVPEAFDTAVFRLIKDFKIS